MICLHSAEFMTAAVAIYEAAGFRRDPANDFDAAGRLALGGVRPVPILAYRLDLAPHHQEEHEESNALEARSGGRLTKMIRQRFLTAHPTRSTR